MDGDHVCRRRVLAGATVVAGAVAGCIGTDSGDDESGSGDGIPPGGIDDGEHRFYLATLDDIARRVELTVYDTFAEEYVIDGTYELPGERGAEFGRVAGVEIRYDVEANVADGGSTTETWIAGACEAYGDGGSQNAAVRIQPGAAELTYVEDDCDELLAGTSAPFGPAREHVVGDGWP